MYERSAVVLEKYFAEKFYYKDRSNIKINYDNYCKLIEILEKYQEVSKEEDNIINECEDIADKIKKIQKEQNSLYERNIELQEDKHVLFESIGEAAGDLAKQLEKIEVELEKNNEQMKPLNQEFVEALTKFNETSSTRSEYGKKRRKIEKEYRDTLEETVNNINEIDKEKITKVKKAIASEDFISDEELKEIMLKNGEKEKISFDTNVIENSINFSKALYKHEAKVFVDVYDKTNNLIDETNNSSVKMKRYKKIAKDAKNRVRFINVQKEYLTQFLDNERLSVSLGKEEHKKTMKEACNDFQKDTEQIGKLNEILQKEIIKKATQKMYRELYSPEYLIELQRKEKEFDNKLSELNLSGKILNPIYWRIESIEKLYATFDSIVTEEYGRDLSKFKIEEEPEQEDEEVMGYYDNMEEEAPQEKEKKELIIDNEDDDEEEYKEDFFEEDEKETGKKAVNFDKMINFEDDEDDEDDEYDEYDEDYDFDFDFGDEDKEDIDEDDNLDDDQRDEDDDKFESGVEIKIQNNKLDNEEDYDYDFDIEDEDKEDVDEDFNDDENDENDEDDEEDYDDLDIILQNRKKLLGKNKSKNKNKKEKPNKKKGIFGFGKK